MTEIDRPIVVPIEADVSGFSDALKDLRSESRAFGAAFTSALKSAVVSGKSFEDVLRSLALRLSRIALSSALKPLERAVSGLFSGVVSGIGSTATASPLKFANGGVIGSPTFFDAGGRLGLAGEAGAEAILPLARGADGRLGVRAQDGGAPMNITFNVSTPDVAGFRKSEAQLSAMLARTVDRSRRLA